MKVLRFVYLFFKYIPHVWYAANFKHSSYVVHGTNNETTHESMKNKLGKIALKNTQ